MKTFFFLCLLSTTAFAETLKMDYFNWELSDVKEQGLTKEGIFQSLNRDLIKLGQSICANRALMWLHQMKTSKNVDGSKIFLFYTAKTGRAGNKNWWYHVAPMINEGGKEYVLDAGFPGFIDGPLSPEAWLTKFSGAETCLEIKPEDRDLVALIEGQKMFPETTAHGTHACYFVKAPAGLWFPGDIMEAFSGSEMKDEAIDPENVYEACKEAATSPLGRVLGTNKKKCRQFAYQGQPLK